MTEHQSPSKSAMHEAEAREEISFLDVLSFVARHRRVLFWIPTACGVIAFIVSLVLPAWYTATARILPPQQSQSTTLAMLGQLGPLASGVAAQTLGIKNPTDIYVAMLRSRTIADELIGQYGLQGVYGEDLLHFTRKELARNSSINAGRDGVITIEVDDKDPQRATDLANSYVKNLRNLTGRLAVSEAAQRRLFFEEQLQKAKNELASAEAALRRFTEQAGLISPESQIGLSVSAAASLRAQISAREIQLAAMRTFATESNPEIRRLHQELIGLRDELAKMEKASHATKGDVMVPFGKAPEIGLEYLRRYRDVKYHETLFEVLAKQYEIAKIDEAKDATVIQVLDMALPPERRSKPQRGLITLVTILAASAVAVVFALVRDAFERAARDPSRTSQLRELHLLVPRRWRDRV